MQKQKKSKLVLFGLKILIGLSFTLFLTSCGMNNLDEEQTELSVFYINKDYTSIVETKYFISTDVVEIDNIVKELFEQLELPSEDVSLKTPINSSFYVEKYVLDKKQLTIDFSTGYTELDPLNEVLTRAAIVQTFLQLESVDSVLFLAGGISITDFSEQAIGRMDENTFINSTGSQINSYEKATVQIYFANEEGTALLPVQRTLVYSSNISREKLIVEQIIEGPANEDSYPTINSETMVQSVTVKDGVCYVNLSKEFLTRIDGVTAETVIYSVVNSLIEINNINKVQILIEGKTEGFYMGLIPLTELFERNLELIER